MLVFDCHFLTAGAVKDHFLDVLRQFFKRRGELEIEMLGQPLEHIPVPIGHVGPTPRLNRPLAYRQRPVRHDEIGIYLHLLPQPVADLAGSKRRIEGEHPRRQLFVTEVTVQAGKLLAEEEILPFYIYQHRPLRHFQCGFDRIGQTAL